MKQSSKSRLAKVWEQIGAADVASDGLWGADGRLQFNPFVIALQAGRVIVRRNEGETVAALRHRAMKQHRGREWVEVYDPDPCAQNFIHELSTP